MRDCTSANGDRMTASKRECWGSTPPAPRKAIVSTVKEEEGITFHAGFPSEERARTALSSDKVMGCLCLCSKPGPDAPEPTHCRWWRLSTPLKNEWIPQREKSDQQLRKSKKQKPEIRSDQRKWVQDKEIHIPHPLLKFCIRGPCYVSIFCSFQKQEAKALVKITDTLAPLLPATERARIRQIFLCSFLNTSVEWEHRQEASARASACLCERTWW